MEILLKTASPADAQTLLDQLDEPGAQLSPDQSAVTLPVEESTAYSRFLHLAKLPTVSKAAVSLPSQFKLGSKLFESPWTHVTITQAERDQHLRRDIWDMMVEYAKEQLPDGKVVYSFPNDSVKIADLALYVAHSCHPDSLIAPSLRPSPEEQAAINRQPIALDYYGFQNDTETIDYMVELTYDTYFSLRDYQYLDRLARGSTFAYDVPLCTDDARVKHGLTPSLEQSVATHRARFPDRTYKNVRIIARDQEGAQECCSIVKSLGFQLAFYDDHLDRICDL